MTSFLTLAKKRASIRAFKDQPVPEELLLSVLEAGRIAPSACNYQPWHFIVIRDPDQMERLADCYKPDWFRTAPLVIAICAERDKAWVRWIDNRNYAEVDASIAADHMTLCAADLGLGTCWIGAFNPQGVCEVLELPPEIEPIALLPLGWPDEVATDTPRKSLEEIVHYDKW